MSETIRIKRYDIMSNAHDSWFVERETGNYVSYKDYAELERHNRELCERLKINHHHYITLSLDCSKKEEILKVLAKAIVETQTIDDSEDGQYCPFCFEKHSYNDDKYPHKSDCVVLLAQEVLK